MNEIYKFFFIFELVFQFNEIVDYNILAFTLNLFHIN